MSTFVNEPASVDPENFSVRRAITIAAPAERVWAAITEPQHLARWFPQRASLAGTAVGSRGVFSFDGHGDIPVVVEDIDAPRMISYRWGNELGVPTDIDSGTSTVFTFTLEPADGGTRLTVVETGFDALANPGASMEDNRVGWTWELDELVAYLEGAA